MVMEVVNTFPTELFIFQNDQIDNDALINFILSIENPPVKRSSTISLLIDFRQTSEFANLFSWFENCLERIKNHMKYDCESFKITNSWVNLYKGNSGMNINLHRHSLSFLSGVYYFTDGAPTFFEDPVLHRTQAQLEILRSDYSPLSFVEAKAGKLCIFPSWLYHGSQPQYDSNDRFILSFNSLPAGKINFNIGTDSKAEINVL